MLQYFWPSDDEQLAGQWQDSHFDEDGGFWATVQQCGAVFALATAVVLGAASTTAAQGAFSQSQDEPAGSLTLSNVLPEEYWQNSTAPANWPQPSVFADDDVHPTFVQVFTPDDGDQWRQLVPPDPGSNFVQLPFLDPEEIPVGSFPPPVNPEDDSGAGWPGQPPWDPNWTLLFFLDDGSTVPVFQYDEDFWTPQVPAQNWAQPGQPFSDSDENNLIPQLPAEDVVWLQLAPPTPAALTWIQPFAFEQNEPGNLVSFAQEDYFQNPTPPVPDGLYPYPQWVFETNDPAGSLTLVLDDAFRPDFVPPDPGSLIWAQQWAFEQSEPLSFLVGFHDEDLWTPQIPAANWSYQPPFVFDEIVVPQSSATIDEVYQSVLVFPVQASNFVALPYVPDPEEIPAGKLFTPAPPPPPAPCTPPRGFDADTSITYFGGNTHPTQVLFCRICKSAKPLLVRGDYAIWCQDCCAFVSKQDTVMGTVRAPGTFKGVF